MAGNINKSVNVAINILNGVQKQVGSIVTSFGKITKAANNTGVAVDNLNKKLASLKTPANLKSLDKDLRALANINGKGIGSLATGLKKLDGIKFPDFKKLNKSLQTHAKRVNSVTKAYKDLSVATKGVNLKGIVSNAKSGSSAINNLNNSAKKSGTTFSQWGYAIGSASTGLSKFGTQLYGVTRGFSAVSKELSASMLIFTSAFATMFALKGVVADVAAFDDAIRAAGAVAGASSQDIMAFTDAAREMGETTRYTATEAAEALKALAMTGLDVSESIATLPTVLNLAAAANMDLGRSADIVTNIMVGYGKTVEDLPRIADLMVAGFTSANTTLEQLGVALQYVGPVAKSAGLSLEETTGILSSLANAGYRGSKAGTTLRTAISRLLSPTEKMEKAMGKYNLTAQDFLKDNGNIKDFSDVLELLRQNSVSTGDALILFGKRAGPGILSLVDQGTEAIAEMNAEIENAEGIAIKTAYEMEAGLGGSLRKLRSMWQELSLAIGEVIQQDVADFVDSLTKTLKDNKDEIAAVVTQMIKFVGAITKVVGWLIEFVAENAKVIASLGALTLAIKFLTRESQLLLGINLLGFFTNLSGNVNFKAMISGINGVSKALKSYAATASVVGSKAALSGLFSGLSGASMGAAITNVKRLRVAMLTLITSVRSAITAFIATNPILVALTVALVGLYAAIKITNKDYEGMAKKSYEAAKASDELNRKLEYQLAELKLINSELDKSDQESFINAQQRLIDVLNDSNIPIERRIELLKQTQSGEEGARKTIEELRKAVEAEKKANDLAQLKNIIKARNNQQKAVDETAKTMVKYHGILRNGSDELKNYSKEQESIRNDHGIINKVVYDTMQYWGRYFNTLEDVEGQYQDQSKSLSDMKKSYDAIILKLVKSGASAEDFAKMLRQAGESNKNIEELSEYYETVKKSIDKAKESEEERQQEIQKAITQANQLSNAYETSAKKMENVYGAAQIEILRMQADGVISADQAEKAKLQAATTYAQQRVDAARLMYKQIEDAAVEEKAKALKILEQEEAKAMEARKAQLSAVVQAQRQANDKIVAAEKKKTDAIEAYNEATHDAKVTYMEAEREGKEDLKDDLEDLEEDLADEIEDINEDLQKELKKLDKERLEAKKDLSDELADLELDLEDRLRKINQRGMSDKQKDRDNEKAANEKYRKGIEELEKARRDGDEAALKRGEELLNQAADLYEGLDDEKDARRGVQKVYEELAEAKKIGHEQELKAIDEAKQAEKDKAKQAKEDATNAAKESAKEMRDAFAEAMQDAWDKYLDAVDKAVGARNKAVQEADAEIQKQKELLGLIDQEKTAILANIDARKQLTQNKENDSKIYEKAIESANQATEAVKKFVQEVDTSNDKKVNIAFESDGQTIDEAASGIKEKIIQASDGTYINVKIQGEEGGSLTEQVENEKQKIESVEITIKPTVDVTELEAVNQIIEELNAANINVVVKCDYADLNSAKTVYDALKNKTVEIVLGLTGMDKWVKAKNIYDSLKNKKVTITVDYKETGSKPSTNAATGGLMVGAGEPAHFASGGSVFKRLSKRFIDTGGGKKDDVPAMLMKGEFVQKVSAVKKYGVDFMKRLNAGLIPQSVAKMYNAGGYVSPEHYASGGHVGFRNTSKMLAMLPTMKKKELLEIFGEKASNKEIGIKAENITTEIGAKSIIGMQNALTDVVSAFASGGGITTSISNFADQRRKINNAFGQEIATANATGNKEISALLKQERDDILKESTRLREELNSLKKEYDSEVEETTKDYLEEKADRDENYKRESDDAKLDYDRESSDADLDFSREEADYKKDKSDLEKEYQENLQELTDEFSSSDFLKTLTDSKEALNEIFGQINGLGLQLGGMSLSKRTRGRKYTWDQLEKLRKNIGYNQQGTEMPDFGKIEGYLDTHFGFDHDEKNKYLDDYTSKIASMDEVFSEMDEILSAIGYEKFATGMSDGKLNKTGIERYKAFLNSNNFGDAASMAAEALSKAEKEKVDSEYKLDLSELENDFAITKDDYETEKSRRDTDYGTEKDRRDEDYNTESTRSEADYKQSIADLKASYEQSVSDSTTSSGETVDEIKKTANENIEAVKTSMSEAIAGAKDSRDEQIGLLSSGTQTSSDALVKTVTDFSSMNILDYMRKRYGIRGYNTGGFVNDTPTSIPGKDSILSALAPHEYVIKAPVVRKFGKGFFDAINNFKIPHFNTGGLVGKIGGELISGDVGSTVRHILDLNINGSKQGELTGSEMTINKLLNDLTLAKMRA